MYNITSRLLGVQNCELYKEKHDLLAKKIDCIEEIKDAAGYLNRYANQRTQSQERLGTHWKSYFSQLYISLFLFLVQVELAHAIKTVI